MGFYQAPVNVWREIKKAKYYHEGEMNSCCVMAGKVN